MSSVLERCSSLETLRTTYRRRSVARARLTQATVRVLVSPGGLAHWIASVRSRWGTNALSRCQFNWEDPTRRNIVIILILAFTERSFVRLLLDYTTSTPLSIVVSPNHRRLWAASLLMLIYLSLFQHRLHLLILPFVLSSIVCRKHHVSRLFVAVA
ncbi:hypothetical protein BDV98DRAFT_566688 [Pterulicium gracile]|uniref:Uncharacterized protein n=1 Tax=Pterulicium gracile TaxID=1884261 RepID=A0A5C3QL92_9AGAR|nr:hypothetical protein BDV98DRAFT_566688 [Pterula gracilis]